jgi:hypothetical protein
MTAIVGLDVSGRHPVVGGAGFVGFRVSNSPHAPIAKEIPAIAVPQRIARADRIRTTS